MEGIPLQIAFWVLAAVTVGAALAVVLLRDVFRAALLLVLCFFAVAGIYILLHADFLAAVQILIYVGAIAVLIIFAIMLTRGVQQGNPSNRLQLPALVISGLMLAALISIFVGTDWLPQVAAPPLEQTTAPLADVLFNKFILPFEIASVLLLAAIIGAIVLVREK